MNNIIGKWTYTYYTIYDSYHRHHDTYYDYRDSIYHYEFNEDGTGLYSFVYIIDGIYGGKLYQQPIKYKINNNKISIDYYDDKTNEFRETKEFNFDVNKFYLTLGDTKYTTHNIKQYILGKWKNKDSWYNFEDSNTGRYAKFAEPGLDGAYSSKITYNIDDTFLVVNDRCGTKSYKYIIDEKHFILFDKDTEIVYLKEET